MLKEFGGGHRDVNFEGDPWKGLHKNKRWQSPTDRIKV